MTDRIFIQELRMEPVGDDGPTLTAYVVVVDGNPSPPYFDWRQAEEAASDAAERLYTSVYSN